MAERMSRILVVEDDAALREALTDTLLDLANYAVLAILALEAPQGDGILQGAGPGAQRVYGG